MKVSKSRISLDSIFKGTQKAILTPSDVAKLTGLAPAYLEVALHRAVKRGTIIHLERQKYCIGSTHPFAVASNIAFPSYISFLSALSHHNLTTQMPRQITVASLRNRKPVMLGDDTVSFVALSAHRIFGYDRITLDGCFAFMATPEKAIVDSLYLPRHCPISESFAAIQAGTLDVHKILDFVRRMDSIVLLKRLGYLLDLARIDIPENLTPLLNRKLDLLNPLLPAKGDSNSKWKLIINERLEL
jgi:predicted transcriptional regulator of viral defense system